MMEIRKILVPIDFSEHSQQAFDEAVGLAKRFGAELVLFHSYELPIPSFGRVPHDVVPPESYVDAIRAGTLQNLRKWGDKARAQKVRAQEQISAGYPPSEIAALAENVHADLIVMGTRGLSGLEHVLLGSVAERTIRIAPCPVMTVKARVVK